VTDLDVFEGARWRKSTTSDSDSCVEVAYAGGFVGVRDTKDKGAGPVLVFNRNEWTAFLEGMSHGEFSFDALAK
jgi:hypothetical protein